MNLLPAKFPDYQIQGVGQRHTEFILMLNKKEMIATVGKQYDEQVKSFILAHPEMTYPQIAEFFRVSVDVVYRVRRQCALPHRPKGARKAFRQASADPLKA